MYSVDGNDRVVALDDLPRSSVGAPCPLVVQDESTTVVAYYLRTPRVPGQVRPRVISGKSSREPAAMVRFQGVVAALFGPPNDEAFEGHPLAARGLEPYSAAEILDSSWIGILERMNRVHFSHRSSSFSTLRHFILTFHDRTFECVARGYEFALAEGPLDGLAASMLASVRHPRDPIAR